MEQYKSPSIGKLGTLTNDRVGFFKIILMNIQKGGIQYGMGDFTMETIIATFFKDSTYFIKGKDFIKTFYEMEGLYSSAFHFRVLEWLSE